MAAPEFLKRGFDYLAANPALDRTVRFLVLAALGYATYRFVMSRFAFGLRKMIPILGTIYARRQVQDLIRDGEYAQAGELLLEAGELDHASRIFQEGNLFGRAADVYLKQKKSDQAALMYERAGDFEKAASLYIERKQYDRAEASLEKMGKLDAAGDLYLSRGELPLAARAFLRSQRYLEAARVFVKMEKVRESCDAYGKAFDHVKARFDGIASEVVSPEAAEIGIEAANHMERVKEFKRAAALFAELSRPADAARCYAGAGEFKKAGELAQAGGDLSQAAKYWEKSGDPRTAARLEGERLVVAGESQGAIAKFQEAEEFSRAADLYLELHEPIKAAQMYERGEDFHSAASLYRDAGQLEEAGNAFEKDRDYREAVACYRKANLPEREAAILEKLGDFVSLAECLGRQGDSKTALQWLEKVRENDPEFRKALSMKGKFLLKSDPVKAKEYLDRAVSMVERLTSEDVDAVYNLAVVSEQTQTESKALDVLERALVQDRIEHEARGKAENLRRMLTEKIALHSRMISSPGADTDGTAAFPRAESAGSTSVKATRYVPVKEIGRGGMGIVYTARDMTLDRIVALKILPESLKTNERAVATFLREGKAAAALNHPNIVIVHDAGMQAGQYYIAMEFIDGRTIKEILRIKKRLTLPSVLEVLRQLLSALAYAHSKNVVHRDLTTNNIMWTQQKSVKIMDFGLAKMITELMSEQSIIGGTPSFMSPEQTLGKPIDHRTDIYSLGICIYEMLLGELPFIGGDLGYHHLHTPAPDPRARDSQVPEVFSEIILRCMQKEPEKRFQSIAEIQEIIGKIP
ncbi:MAG: protein kinase [Pseudomonadota bacterium]